MVKLQKCNTQALGRLQPMDLWFAKISSAPTSLRINDIQCEVQFRHVKEDRVCHIVTWAWSNLVTG